VVLGFIVDEIVIEPFVHLVRIAPVSPRLTTPASEAAEELLDPLPHNDLQRFDGTTTVASQRY
jgi:hypothetical protein